MRAGIKDDTSRFDRGHQHAVRQELGHILASSTFSASRRCSQFLQFVVERTLSGHSPGDLKERAIGADVFGLPANYDPAENSVVRVTANEVRKKLAQYYVESGPEHEVRIGLPAGSYSVEFRWDRTQETTSGLPRARLRPSRILIGAVATTAVLVAAALYLSFRQSSAPTAMQQFWEPTFRNPKPVDVCLANPVGYVPSRAVVRDYLGALSLDQRLEPFIVPSGKIAGHALVAVTDQFTGVGDAYAAIGFCALFARMSKSYQLRIGNDVAFADLRDSPAILIGAYSNRWTREMTGQLRFVFDMENLENVVRDRKEQARKWGLPGPLPPDWKVPEDYAIISRVLGSKTGEVLTCAGGLTNYGTRAAGEFLTNPSYLERAMREAPADWPRKNVQIVIHTKVIGNTPCPPEVVATYFW